MSEIRTLSNTDLPALLELQRLAFRSEAALYPGQHITALTETLDDLRRDCASRTVLGAFEQGRLIGSVRGFVSEGVSYRAPDGASRGAGAGNGTSAHGCH